jgi:hypothetical protein
MKKLVLLSVAVLVAVGTSFAHDGGKKLKKHKRVKYHQCDAYKTHYAPNQARETPQSWSLRCLQLKRHQSTREGQRCPFFITLYFNRKKSFILFKINLHINFKASTFTLS